MITTRLVPLTFVLVLAAACGGPMDAPNYESKPTTPAPAQDPSRCVDGQEGGCRCEDGRSGAMTCVDGAFGACVCEDVPPPPPSCVEGQSSSCTCTSGEMGAQVCRGGQLEACVCETPNDCTPGATRACSCADGREGSQSCNPSGDFDACVCEELSCVEQQCAIELALCDVNCLATLTCMERCDTASCRYHCADNIDSLTKERVNELWTCSQGCGLHPSVIPAPYPQIRPGQRGRLVYTESAEDFGETPVERDRDAAYPFGDRQETMFGRGYQASFGSWLREDAIDVQIVSLEPYIYFDRGTEGEAGIKVMLGGLGLFSSRYTRSNRAYHVEVAGSAGGVVWGRIVTEACSNYTTGCIGINGLFSAHTER